MTGTSIMRIESLLIGAVTFALAACGSPDTESTESPGEAAPVAPELPARIVAERGGFIPEGVEYDAERGRLLTGSLSEGDIFQIHGDGRVTPVITDADLLSSVGIEVDAPRDRLLVANSDRAVFDGSGPGQARLGVYDLNAGTRLAMVDLAATITNPPTTGYFANDAVAAPDGTIYVTDTMQNVIYRVSPDYQASLWHRFPPSDGLGLNGIVYHPSGYLLVAGGSVLYKVPVSDPSTTTPVAMTEAVEGQDGMVWTADGLLAIVSNSESRVVALSSNDDWASAQVAGVAPFTGQGTTGAVVGDDVYVVQPHFADAEPPVFERVSFP
jgi:sugar lactone lactonase YvrE